MTRLMLSLAAAATLAASLPAFAGAANAQSLAAQPLAARPAAVSVNHREVNQQRRIEQGERSGALTRHEAYRLEHREFRLARREAAMRYRAGGDLTRRAHRILARQETRDSGAIYRLKHNARVD